MSAGSLQVIVGVVCGHTPAILTSTKIIAVESKAIEHNLFLMIMYFKSVTNVVN